MKNHAILRLLLSGLLLYVAWPYIPLAKTSLATTFWGLWLGFFLLVIGANLATFLEIINPPSMEQEKIKQRNTH